MIGIGILLLATRTLAETLDGRNGSSLVLMQRSVGIVTEHRENCADAWGDGSLAWSRRRHWAPVWPLEGSELCSRAASPTCTGDYALVKTGSPRCYRQTCSSYDANSECCCGLRSFCTEMACPTATHVQNATAAETVRCRNFKCEQIQEDVDSCCSERAMCDASACSATHVLKLDAAASRCKGTFCSVVEDQATCCDARAPCNMVACDGGWFLKASVESALSNGLCAGKECSLSDQDACCLEVSHECMEACVDDEAKNKKDKDASLLDLDGPSCPQNMSLICNHTATCEELACPSNMASKVDAAQILCARHECSDDDQGKCCDVRAKCASLQCPDGYFKTSIDIGDFAYDITYCAGTECSLTTDLDKCCVNSDTWLMNRIDTKITALEKDVVKNSKQIYDDRKSVLQESSALATVFDDKIGSLSKSIQSLSTAVGAIDSNLASKAAAEAAEAKTARDSKNAEYQKKRLEANRQNEENARIKRECENDIRPKWDAYNKAVAENPHAGLGYGGRYWCDEMTTYYGGHDGFSRCCANAGICDCSR